MTAQMLPRFRAAAEVQCMMTKMASKMLDRKLKLERVTACLNYRNFVKCDDIGKFEERFDFGEIEGEAWVKRKLGESHF